MDTLPLVTIGVTCHNAAGTIARAVGSALGQDWPALEVLVVDDASEDDSATVVARLAAQDFRCRLVRHTRNQGVAAARNTLLDHARGSFVAFFDDDDESAPDRVRRQVERIRAYEAATGAEHVICTTARRLILPGGEIVYEPCLGGDTTPGPHGTGVAELILNGRPIMEPGGSAPTCAQMARRSVYRQLGGFDPKLRRNEDTDFNLRAALAGAHFAGISAPLVMQTVTVTRDKAFEEERANMLYFIDKHRHFLDAQGDYAFARSWFDMKFDLLVGRRARALTRVCRLMVRWPLRTMRRVAWSWPNRQRYRRAVRAHRAAMPLGDGRAA